MFYSDTHNCSYRRCSQTFLVQYVKLHSILIHIVLDRKLQFVVYFTKELYYLLDIEIAFFIAWYLQLVRQTELVNEKPDQYL